MALPATLDEDVTFPVGNGTVEAWLVRPNLESPGGARPAIVMWHWLDTEAPDGNRTEFLDEARQLAGRGAVCLLPQGRFPWSIHPSGSAADAAEVRAEVDRLRAGLDFGAMYGVLAAAEDPRVAALALIAPTPRWGDWFLPFWAIDEDRIDYLRAMRPLDPVEVIGRVAPRPILLQMGRRDFYIPLMAGLELRRAGGDASVELKAYDAEHDLRVDDARADRLAFLERTLRLARAG
jgi:hypothetical protein